MKISISIQCDSENTHPTATLDFWPANERVSMKLSDSDREVSALTSDLLKIASILQGKHAS